ncbi:LysR family transcriptional regulator [Halomonas ramblicola]|uniref:LysR family transcriptional regulator n=1 Tax=Halomonas ramblicola TaxID=747349 RepID=UPI0025B4645D|nr:LysR family transcriptional regulator [Halomonas ramblicola]MDN3523021.1 LysR family transcriptional regulator [Halomonas ramblicola]
MNTRFYETFIWLSKLGNFSKTAEKLHATQPTITSRIQALEDSFDVELYTRGTKPLKLTPEGKLVLQYAKKIVDLEGELESTLSDNELKDTLKVGVVELATVTWVPDFIRELQDRYPKTVLEFKGGLQSEIMQKIRNDELDLVFVLGPQSEPELHNEKICTFSMSWVASPEFFSDHEEMDISEINGFPIILPPSNASTYPYLKEYLLVNGMEDAMSDTQMVKLDCVFSGATGLSLVKKGIGVMPLPTAAVIEEIKAGALVKLPIRQSPPNIYMTACLKKKNQSVFLNDIVAIAEKCAKDYAESVSEGAVWV